MTEEEIVKFLFKIYNFKNKADTIEKEELLTMLYSYPREDIKHILSDAFVLENNNMKDFLTDCKDESFTASSHFFRVKIQIQKDGSVANLYKSDVNI